jgi:hypothetical protein
MAKESGLGAAYFFGGVDLSGDTNALDSISKSLALLPATGIDKSAMERLPGLLDGQIAWQSHWNPTNAHAVLSTLPRTDRIASYWHRGTLLGTHVASLVSKQTNYDPTRDDKGGIIAKVDTLANAFWLDWGLGITAGKLTQGGAGNGTGVDFNNWGGGFSFGLQAYLHVFAITGTSCTVKLQHSNDDGAGDAYTDITAGGFVAASVAPQAQRIQTSRTLPIKRWIRLVTTGTFSSCQFAVSVTANRTTYPL